MNRSKYLVVVLGVGNLDDHLLEAALLPCNGRVLGHRIDCVVELLVLLVQEHELVPEVCLSICEPNSQRDTA